MEERFGTRIKQVGVSQIFQPKKRQICFRMGYRHVENAAIKTRQLFATAAGISGTFYSVVANYRRKKYFWHVPMKMQKTDPSCARSRRGSARVGRLLWDTEEIGSLVALPGGLWETFSAA